MTWKEARREMMFAKRNVLKGSYIDQAYDKAIEALSQLEQRKGEWIRNDNGTYSCSVCQSWIPEEQHNYARYCLYCGAEMRENNNEK